ncbi:hypothetical protein QW131_16385 [Roseibium salinum]|nr:hypothetical protein [Roseibium salinum]
MTSEPSSSLSTSFITARPCRPGDLSRLLQLNNAAVPAVNELTAEELLDLINSALICLVAEAGETAAGFLLCIGDGTGYESRNYRWLSERLSNFAYTDRIAVDETLRGGRRSATRSMPPFSGILPARSAALSAKSTNARPTPAPCAFTSGWGLRRSADPITATRRSYI